MSKENVLKSKRFVIRKSLVGKNQVISFTNKKGETVKYNHDVAYKIMKSNLEKLACFIKYKSSYCIFKNTKTKCIQSLSDLRIFTTCLNS